ncbi:Hypothetical predicted protein [Cloeon dipterum]|uniref:Helicase POLQ-like n=1 Tax=Cloeon dipterum TaxID=197152 RepID=A0A8S1D1N5_9INSE|nr:Hypothetical predicted protein [Cloeon dipterum]
MSVPGDDESLIFDESDLQAIDEMEQRSQQSQKTIPCSKVSVLKRKSDSPSKATAAETLKRPLVDSSTNNSSPSSGSGGGTTQDSQNSIFAFGQDLQQILLSNANKSLLLETPKRKNLLDMVPSLRTQDCSVGFESLGSFYGLPDRVLELLKEHKGVDKLYDWQTECLGLRSVLERKNFIYSISTSGGKTLVAEILLFREMLCRKKNTILVLPYVSIVQEKVRSLSPFALEMNFLVEEYAAGKGILPPKKRLWKNVVFVATIEKALALFNSLAEEKRLHEIGMVVVDEIHMIGEAGRGAVLESLIAKFMFSSPETQIVGMSATIGNLTEVASFLRAEVYSKEFRPVVLHEFLKVNNNVLAINDKSDEHFVQTRNVLSDDKRNDPDGLKVLVAEVAPSKSCLIFCATKKNCENVAMLLAKSLDKSMKCFKGLKKVELYHALKEEGSGVVCDVLKRTIPYGVAYHHSGLTMNERNLLEEGFRAGVLCCLCCTSTLAAGVNLPAKRVILRSPKIGRDYLTLSQYKQMTGRAGRAGMDDAGESILICQESELEEVKRFLRSGMTWCHSQLGNTPSVAEGLILSLIGLDLATSCQQLCHFLRQFTLLGLQSGQEVEQLVEKVVAELYKNQVLVLKEDSPLLEDTSELKVSPLGRAAMKANLTMDHAKTLLNDLSQAQGALNLLSPLHLLYLIISPERVESNRFSAVVFANVLLKLSSNDKKTAELIGITEGVISTLMRGCKPKSVPDCVLNRFYLALLLSAMWDGQMIWNVSDKFDIPRGDIQSLMVASASQASNIKTFCQEYEGSLWCFHSLLTKICDRLSHCGSSEIMELMELPAVKKGRAQQLFKAGYKTLLDVASANPKEMVGKIEHLPTKVANQLVSSAKMLLMEKAESLREEAEIVFGSMKEQLLESFSQSPNRTMNQSVLL